MKIVVAVCVFNRFQNIKLWIDCWFKSYNNGLNDPELVIIHNYYGNEAEAIKFKKLCDDNSVKYVPRNGPGFDIGAFSDVCNERLLFFNNNWDYLLWCTDDIFPMSKDFITPFIKKLQEPGVGVACMQISRSVSSHVRTTGFCITKEVAGKISFPPIKTKQDCYLFEHRGGSKTFTNQIRQMGLSCEAVAPIAKSPLWDSDHPNKHLRVDRQEEFNEVWGIKSKDKVVFICPVYQMYPQIISSLICQTHKNWELLLIHNGPLNGMKYDIPDDPRIKFIVYPEATGKWGHFIRQWALNEVKEERLCPDADYVVIQNADNYLTPRYTEYLVKGFEKPHTIATYCSDTVHSYKNWQVLPAKLQLGFIDCGAVMVKKNVACEIGWRDVDSHSSDWTYFQDIANKYSWSNFNKINGCLFVHNVIIFSIMAFTYIYLQ